jgi:hypothetical protein
MQRGQSPDACIVWSASIARVEDQITNKGLVQLQLVHRGALQVIEVLLLNHISYPWTTTLCNKADLPTAGRVSKEGEPV